MKNPKAVSVLILFFISLTTAAAAQAVVFKYLEDFTTTNYKDHLNTTAWWDTPAGQLKLYPFVVTLAGSYNTPGNAQDVYISGNHAFVADLSSGLQIISIINPSGPVLVGTCAGANPARGVHVAGDHAFLACDHGGIYAVDISDLTTPVAVGQEDTPTDACDIYVSGDHAFIADKEYGLQVFDISDPTAMALVGGYDTPGYTTKGVCVAGDHAFLADGANGLMVIDVTNPTSPTLAGSYNTPGHATGVFVSGNHAFVADGYSGGLQVIDITNPSSPALAGTYSTPDSATGVFVAGDRAYVADGLSGFLMLDITNPAAPVLSGSYNTPGSSNGVFVAGDRAYVADDTDGLQVVEICQLTNPPVYTGTNDTPQRCEGSCVTGDLAFVVDSPVGLRVFDISNPASPVLIGTYQTSYWAYAVDVAGDYAFVADGDELFIIDVSDPTSPMLAGNYAAPGTPFDVQVEGENAFVASGTAGGLQIVDVSNPALPVLVGDYITGGSVIGVSVSGDIAYVAEFEYGLRVFDITDPSSPTLVGGNNPGVSALEDIFASGDIAYGADRNLGLIVWDISDPTPPSHLASVGTPGTSKGVFVTGDHAFVADGNSGLQVFDISNPSNPILKCAYDTPDEAKDVFVAGHHAFVADDESGFQVIQVYQDEMDSHNDTGRSTFIDGSDETIVSVSVTTSQTAGVTWEISANGGANWQGIAPGSNWNQVVTPGTNLMWRSTHTWSPGLNPTVSQLQIDWLFDKPVIMSSEDVPHDQGGYVLLEWKPSGYDVYNQQTVTHYSVWRALHTVPSTVPEGPESPLCSPADIGAEFQGPAFRADQGYYWEWLSNITAHYFEGYAYAAPTYYDSTAGDTGMHYFQVISHTSDQWVYWTSRVDSGYSVDNLAPCAPEGFMVAYNTGSGNALSWEESPEEDFQYFRIYRSNDPYFVPSPDDLIGTTTEVNWNDPEYDGWHVYYKITAVDFSGNESPPASAGTATAVAETTIPRSFALYQNVPNPFTPTTTIRFDVPRGGGNVILRIYDVGGRLIRTLVDGFETEGEKQVSWNGRDGGGRGVASGIYFCRIDAPGFERTRKIVLLH